MAALFTRFEAELSRLQAEYQVVGLYADPASWPKGGADGPLAGQRPRGVKTVAEAVGLA